MNAAELAAEFEQRASNVKNRTPWMKERAETWATAARHVRTRLTPTPLQAAAPDMLAALDHYQHAEHMREVDHEIFINAMRTKAKGTPDV